MTREDIIRMAREVGILETMGYGNPHMKAWQEDVVRELSHFAALVAAAAKAEEREACAKVCEDMCKVKRYERNMTLIDAATAIRLRSSEH